MRNLTAIRHRCTQRCDSENEHSVVTAKTSTALEETVQCRGNDVHISVTAMATHSAVTALSVATTSLLLQ